jgi:hypothetical protein
LVFVPTQAGSISLTPSWRNQRSVALAVLTAGFAIGLLQCLPPADYDYWQPTAVRLKVEEVQLVT